MAILHIQYASETLAPDGNFVQVPPQQVLLNRGPLLQVSVTVSQRIATQLAQAGQPIPAPVIGWGVIDTGASTTCIDETVAQNLGLPIIDRRMIASASHAATVSNIYPVHIEIIGGGIHIEAKETIGAPLAAQNLLMLIGRDVLQHCVIIYNGLAGQITLSVG